MMRQAGRHLPEYMKIRETAKNFVDFCFSPKKAAEVTLQPIRRYDMDGAILFADILLIPIGLGRKVDFVQGVGPVLEPINKGDIKNLKINGAAERISPVYETVDRVRSNLSPEKALIGFCGGPWTVATYMIEGKGTPKKEMAKRFAYENPQAMEDLLFAIADSSADYLISQAKAGADVLKIFESWAEGLSPVQFETLVIKPTDHIIKKIRQAGIKKPIIGFPRAAGGNIIPYTKSLEIQALALGTDTSIGWVRDITGPKMCLQGNLDPLALRIGGDVLRDAVQMIIEAIDGPHIFNLGHGVTPDVKIENVLAVVSHLRTGEGQYV